MKFLAHFYFNLHTHAAGHLDSDQTDFDLVRVVFVKVLLKFLLENKRPKFYLLTSQTVV